MLLRTFFCVIRAKNFWKSVPFRLNFEAYLNNSLRFSEAYFSYFTACVRIIFVEKGNLKFSDSKM